MALRITGNRQWDAWQAKVLPPVEQLRPWLWSIPVPIPRSPLRYVNIYVFRVSDGVVMVDTGWPAGSSWEALRSGLKECGFKVGAVRGMLMTHMHPDHYSLAVRVREESGAWIAVHESEATLINTERQADTVRQRQIDYLTRAGANSEDAEASAGPLGQWQTYIDMPVPDRTFADGDIVLEEHGLQAVWTPGHSPGHSCYYLPDERLLISGDHILPRITPNIATQEVGGRVPLRQYFESLRKVRHLTVDDVLPGHEYRFSGHRDRIDYLISHHTERLREIEEALAARPDVTTWQLASQLSWSRPWGELAPGQWPFALGETLSHLDLLREHGKAIHDGSTGHIWSAALATEGRAS